MKVGISVLVCLLVIDTGLVKGSCPSVCSCSSPYYEHIIDCRSRSLGNIPADLLNDTLYLRLQDNNITTIDVQFCMEMPQLKQLYLFNNQISAIPVNTFVDCEQLNTIQLQYNEISTLDSFTFMNLPNLHYLYLSNNKIQLLKSYTFINLPNVYYITLNENNISHIEEHAFGTFTSLNELDLESNPLNCDCTIYPFWSWLVGRPIPEYRFYQRESATCSNGTLVKSLQVDVLTKCNPDNFQCFNGGKHVTRSNGHVVCECIGNWTGSFCQESRCISHDCGFGNCYIEPVNGTAQCVFEDRCINCCPGMFGYVTNKINDVLK
ncbi:uncharacterized protein LOC143052812 [Mytilus galloprovincialis]|uniref:uncharacterized protein LOC143052812 n=1 Tax=Mytilus galloprovincialis TaxID=29158 RepID=UPI003F7C022F